MHLHQFAKTTQNNLIEWFEQHKRPMPWRETNDPYKIWISEIMLQQTQVATVKDYYLRFIDKFPDVETLAQADLHLLMKIWEGLGYYSRARNLHQAAKVVVNDFNSRIPDNYHDLITLPGIGRYTAGAILSIAFGKRAPILDGNVIRVLTRVFHITDNVSQTSTQKVLWELAESILPEANMRYFNEALMELGATICKPKNPQCEICPIQQACQARPLEIQNDLPVKTPRKLVPHYNIAAGIIWKNDRFLITLRPPKGLLGNLWEFPGGKVKANETLIEALHREIYEEAGILIESEKLLTSIKHAYTHFKITLHAFSCKYLSGEVVLDPEIIQDYKWIKPAELNQYAFPGANRKVIQKINLIGH